MRCEYRTNALDGGAHSHYDVHGRAYDDNVGDDGEPCGMSMDSGSGANSSDPSIGMGLCNGMDATNLANSPSSMVNAMPPTMLPRTSRRYMDGIYIQVR